MPNVFEIKLKCNSESIKTEEYLIKRLQHALDYWFHREGTEFEIVEVVQTRDNA